ncbi:MAG: asparagine synthase (glutamine-hydrolyzing) [Gemmatimonadales bacterium]
MCGIAGILRASGPARDVSLDALGRMAAALRHRGPDGYGFFADARAGLAHVRLSIIDLAGGAQPLTNEDGRLVVVFNGEIYNYVELAAELRQRGHTFRTRSDTEVLVHGWEEWGGGLFGRLNGQFAFVLYDRLRHTAVLARDRFGIRPLFYAEPAGDLVFGSEAKALFASGEVAAAPDLAGLDEVFTFWSARAPRTVFAGVSQLPPGTWALWRDGELLTRRYWEPEYEAADAEPADTVEHLGELLESSVRLRMRADVPVGVYVSGGLDSTVTSSLAASASPFQLRSFSIGFEDPLLDERPHQKAVAGALGTRHAETAVGADDVARVFPDVVWHCETPLVRTAPAPMYHLARLTREGAIKVVLTGEGSDEIFLGYDLFKETAVRRFCSRRPDSRLRPRLFERLYPYLDHRGRGGELWARSFLEAGAADDPLFSHMPRFLLTSRIKDFYGADVREALTDTDVLQDLRDELPNGYAAWSDLERAAWLETTTLLSGYLLSSQGDRMALAHGLEGRFPFLDHRLFAFAAALPVRSRLRVLQEKDVLHRWAARALPSSMPRRAKQPYRAPDAAAFFGASGTPEYVEELLDAAAIEDVGLFEPSAVAGLVRRCRTGRATGFLENQALVGVLSAQIWYRRFMASGREGSVLPLEGADVLLGDGLHAPVE